MATLLDGINEVFKRVNLIAGDSQRLVSLTDSSRQHQIDLAIQLWNEAVQNLYMRSTLPLRLELVTMPITLRLNEREEDLPADLIQIRWPLVRKTETGDDEGQGHKIFEYPGGFDQMRVDQLIPWNFKGLPYMACINPETGKLRWDYYPQEEQAGRVYNMWYDKELVFTNAADDFPFNNAVFRAMVPCVAQLYDRDEKRVFDNDSYQQNLGQAAEIMTGIVPRRKYMTRKNMAGGYNVYGDVPNSRRY